MKCIRERGDVTSHGGPVIGSLSEKREWNRVLSVDDASHAFEHERRFLLVQE